MKLGFSRLVEVKWRFGIKSQLHSFILLQFLLLK